MKSDYAMGFKRFQVVDIGQELRVDRSAAQKNISIIMQSKSHGRTTRVTVNLDR